MNLLNNYYEVGAVILFSIGLMTVLLQRNLIKKIIGLNIMDTSVFLFLAAKGYVAGKASPIIRDGVTDASMYINPVPSGLVLTGIVVAVSVTAFSLALTLRWYQQYHTLDLDRAVLNNVQRGDQ